MKYKLLILLLFTLNCFSQKEFNVYFGFNEDNLNQESIVKFEDWIKISRNIEILSLSGYCDSVDTNDYNKKLAERRVNNIFDLLKKNQVNINENVNLISHGKDFKQSKKQSENRRVTIKYIVIDEDVEFNEVETNSKVVDKIHDEKSKLENKFKNARIGDLIRINNIHFVFNSEKIIPESYPILEELYMIMVKYPKLVIKINGNICCNPNTADTRLSFRRALNIFNFLKKRGIPVNRLAYHGYGSGNPIYPIPEKNEEEKAANRRVEIQIIKK